jgi:hypothetical protein
MLHPAPNPRPPPHFPLPIHYASYNIIRLNTGPTTEYRTQEELAGSNKTFNDVKSTNYTLDIDIVWGEEASVGGLFER